MNNGNPEPIKAPVPTVLPAWTCFNDETLEITPVKIKPIKAAPAKCKGQKFEAKKKVVFVEEEVDSKENSLNGPIFNSTNLIKRRLLDNEHQELNVERAMQELQLSDSFNTQMNEKMTCLLNYKLNDRKYTDLPSINTDTDTDLKPMTFQKKVIDKYYLPKEKKDKKIFQPDLKDFWSDKDFVVEKPFSDFDIQFDTTRDYHQPDEGVGTQENHDYLFYMYNKNDLGISDT